MAMAVNPSRVVLVEVGQVRKMSDTDGLNVIRLHDGIERRRDFAARLSAAGLDVDMDNDNWRDAGSFNGEALTTTDLAPAAEGQPAEEVSRSAGEDLVLTHLSQYFGDGHDRLDTPFDVLGMSWRQVEVALRDLYDSDPPFIRGVTVEEVDYPVVITGLTERGRRGAKPPVPDLIVLRTQECPTKRAIPPQGAVVRLSSTTLRRPGSLAVLRLRWRSGPLAVDG